MTTASHPTLYLCLLGVFVAERLVELVISRRNAAAARARGAVEAGSGHYPVMVALHTLFLISCAAEVLLLERLLLPPLAIVCGAALVGSMALRYWAIAILGERWNTRVLVEPGRPRVVGGPYRWVRHPNYVAVVTEIAALPLLHTAWITAVVFTLANLWMLRVRIGVEEAALDQHCPVVSAAGAASSADDGTEARVATS